MERGPEPSPRPPQGAIGVLIPKCPAASITHKTTIFYLLDSGEARRLPRRLLPITTEHDYFHSSNEFAICPSYAAPRGAA